MHVLLTTQFDALSQVARRYKILICAGRITQSPTESEIVSICENGMCITPHAIIRVNKTSVTRTKPVRLDVSVIFSHHVTEATANDIASCENLSSQEAF